MACLQELDTDVGYGHRFLPDSSEVFSVWWPKEVLLLRIPCCNVTDSLDMGPWKGSIMTLRLQFWKRAASTHTAFLISSRLIASLTYQVWDQWGFGVSSAPVNLSLTSHPVSPSCHVSLEQFLHSHLVPPHTRVKGVTQAPCFIASVPMSFPDLIIWSTIQVFADHWLRESLPFRWEASSLPLTSWWGLTFWGHIWYTMMRHVGVGFLNITPKQHVPLGSNQKLWFPKKSLSSFTFFCSRHMTWLPWWGRTYAFSENNLSTRRGAIFFQMVILVIIWIDFHLWFQNWNMHPHAANLDCLFR